MREPEGRLDFEGVVWRLFSEEKKTIVSPRSTTDSELGRSRERSESRSTKESDTGSAKYGGVRTGETVREGTELEAPPTKDL
ncbi:hypothetical protein TNCV_5030961 [Trichonephila clavipes]|nr:hypothetical protein TNCV_5030961 [Trichonephila clavipes]